VTCSMPDVNLPEAGPYLVRVGWLIDGTGSPVKTDQAVEISGDHICAISPWDEEAPRQALSYASLPIVDATSYVMLPGLMDGHVHLAWSENPLPEVRKSQFVDAYDTARDRIVRHLRRHMESGVIAVRDGGDHHGHALRFKRDGQGRGISAPHIIACGKAFFKAGRYGAIIGDPVSVGQKLPDAIANADLSYADHIKIVNSGLNSLTAFGKQTTGQFDVEELRAAVRIAHQKSLKVMVHANGRQPVMDAVSAGCDSIEHGFFMGTEVLDMMAEAGTGWVPTAVTMKALSETLPPGSPESDMARWNLDHQLEQIDYARRLGVTLGVGTDAGGVAVAHGTAVFQEIDLFMEAGFSLEGAICCASKNNAAMLGFDGTGILSPGWGATFIMVLGGPETRVRNLVPPFVVVVKGKRL
jgi:imidazolonepropionase-like amidohydrolase